MAAIEVPKTPQPLKENVPILNETVARSIAKADAFMKPCAVGKGTGRGTPATRIRLSNVKPKSGRQRKRARDPRDVKFF